MDTSVATLQTVSIICVRLEHCFGVRPLSVLQRHNFEYQVSVFEEYQAFHKMMEQSGEEYASDLKLQNTGKNHKFTQEHF